MSFRVAWNDGAVGAIDLAWGISSSGQRDLILAALSEIESTLQRDPQSVGESRESQGLRVFTVRPVTVRYEVREAEQLVRNLAARVYQRS